MEARQEITEATQFARRMPISLRVYGGATDDDWVAPGERLLPDGLALVDYFDVLTDEEEAFVNRIQGRSYANFYAFIAKAMAVDVFDPNHNGWPAGPVSRSIGGRVGDRNRKPWDAFQRLGSVLDRMMPAGYRFVPNADEVAQVIAGKSAWSRLALTAKFELATQSHYREAFESAIGLSPFVRNAFLANRTDGGMRAVVSEMEWTLRDGRLMAQERDAAVRDFIEIVELLDRMVQAQARADMQYFAMHCDRPVAVGDLEAVEAGFRKAYRWQFLFSGMRHPHFASMLAGLISEAQAALIRRILDGLA